MFEKNDDDDDDDDDDDIFSFFNLKIFFGENIGVVSRMSKFFTT